MDWVMVVVHAVFVLLIVTGGGMIGIGILLRLLSHRRLCLCQACGYV